MPIDSKEKRRSVLRTVGPTPDGTIDATDRRTILGEFAFNLVETVATVARTRTYEAEANPRTRTVGAESRTYYAKG